MENLIDYYVKPHNIVSVDVKEEDIPTVVKDAEIMFKLCSTPIGICNGGLAIAHQQINDKKPLRFFVTNNGTIIVNPMIIRHTNHTVDSKEGCLSFPDRLPIIVQRYNKCEVAYRRLVDGKLTEEMKRNLSGKESKVWQHEIKHFSCDYIY